MIIAAAAIGVSVFLLVAGAHWLEQRLLYRPDVTRVDPHEAGLPQVREEVIGTPDGAQVLAWYGAAKVGQPTLLYFHGNGGSLVTRAERIAWFLERGIGVYMMTYRGYGGSSGRPSERNNVADARLALNALLGMGVAARDIVVYGESLGTGVAVQLASQAEVGGVILDAPYTSIVDAAELHFPALPSRMLLTDRYETMRVIGRVRVPLLVVHGEEDAVIPVEMGRTVFAAAREPKQLATFAGAGHSDHYLFGAFEAILAWLAPRWPQG